MPELPEVHALVTDLRGRLVGRIIKRFDVVSFAALKTFDPPVSALDGQTIAAVDRHGKFLDLDHRRRSRLTRPPAVPSRAGRLAALARHRTDAGRGPRQGAARGAHGAR